MRKAGEMAAKAFRDVMVATGPGVGEGQLESVFEHSVKMQGAQWMAYPPVVAGGGGGEGQLSTLHASPITEP